MGVGVCIYGVSTLLSGESVAGVATTVCGVLGVTFGAAALARIRRQP